MFFSDKFKVNEQSLNDYGALNIWMERDTPLYIDPILIYCNKKYEAWHKKIIKYFNFLYEKTQNPEITKDQLKYFFNFHEIKNNWLGVSKNSNNGRGFGDKLTELLWNNLSFIFEKNDITKDFHIEKSLLLTDKSGKDLISDLITNIIIEDLLEFTETFAKKYIDEEKCCKFKIRSKFDYQIETWKDHEYLLPYITTHCEKKNGCYLHPMIF